MKAVRCDNIAIIGAGFAGLATAYHLFAIAPEIKITVFDKSVIGGGASGIAAGLVHPFAGLRAKLNPLAYEGLNASLALFETASQAIDENVHTHSKVLRLAYSEEIIGDYRKTAANFPSVTWLEPSACHDIAPQVNATNGILIADGWTVHSSRYLEGLCKACQRHDIRFEQHHVRELNLLNDFDKVIICTGAYDNALAELTQLPFSKLRGQILELDWPENLAPLPHPLNSQTYVIMHPTAKSCIVGSTFERGIIHCHPDHTAAEELLRPKLTQMLPQMHNSKINACRAGLRATTASKLPLISQISSKHYYFGALGSKGLLYHALFAEKMARLALGSS